MTAKKNSLEILSANASAFSQPIESLNQIVQAYTEYKIIAEQENTKRQQIKAWKKTRIAEIEAKRDFLMTYLDRSFDERAEKFRRLFKIVDSSIKTGDNQQLALTLNSITELAKSSPFKDLATLSSVKSALDDPNHIWEL